MTHGADRPCPNQANAASMWSLLEDLFPVYRSLCGPGYAQSLERVARELPLAVRTLPSGASVFDWTVPKEFSVKEAYVLGPDGKRYFDFAENSYHLWVYSQPFRGKMSKAELLEHVAVHPLLDHAVPLRVTYYQPKWGLCASKEMLTNLPEGEYEVVIDTVHEDGLLRIGECVLPGESEQEVWFTSYLCHPKGANDNLSGVVLSVELFKLLASLPSRRFTYRLLIWPETIGAISYVHEHMDLVSKVAGGYVVTCVGDGGSFTYKKCFADNALANRAALHVLRHSGHDYKIEEYTPAIGSDERQLNAVGLRLPVGSLMRSMYGEYPEYHTDVDDLDFIRPEYLLKSLSLYWDLVQALEKARFYKGSYVVEPFMTKYGVYPWKHGAGTGRRGNDFAKAYYQLLGYADGAMDLLEIADKAGLPISAFDEAVADFVRVGLVAPVEPNADERSYRCGS